MKKILLFISIFPLIFGCTNAQRTESTLTKEATRIIEFEGDSAYSYVESQVKFGPRIPGSESHRRCVDYLTGKLKSFGAEVEIQEGQGVLYDNTHVPIRNIIGHINPDNSTKVILCAHYDSRLWADNDSAVERQKLPVDGACDGASGVGVLLEIARQLQTKAPSIGVDIIFFDVEDNGTPAFYKSGHYTPDTWCIGSQYWAHNHDKTENVRYAILLDMVGATGATFYREMFSENFAPGIVDMIWNKARTLGYDDYFVEKNGSYITDDHYYIAEITGVPAVDIIQFDGETGTSFGEFWHTGHDDMNVIDQATLEAVGRTVLSIVYDER